MIELTVKAFLSDALPVPVLMEFPENPPEAFVVLHKGDSSRENLLDTAMFVADSYGGSLYDCAALNEQVKAAFERLTELDCVSCVSPAGDYPAFDTKNKRHRYQAVYNLSHY